MIPLSREDVCVGQIDRSGENPGHRQHRLGCLSRSFLGARHTYDHEFGHTTHSTGAMRDDIFWTNQEMAFGRCDRKFDNSMSKM